MLGTFDHDFERIERLLARKRANLSSRDVRVGARDRGADRGKEPRLIDARHLDLDRPRRVSVFLPADFHFPVRVALHDGRAIHGVDGDAATARDETDNRLAREWMAAERKTHQNIVDTFDAN